MRFSNRQADTLTDDQPLPRPRPELAATEQMYDGQPYWVVKDPLSLRYYRFNREEYFIIQCLQEGMTLDQLKQAHLREFCGEELSTHEVATFISGLLEKNLLVQLRPDRDELLYESSRQRRRKILLGKMTGFLYFRISLWDPDRLFNRLTPCLHFVWTWPFFFAYLVLLAIGGSLIIRRWDDFTVMFINQFFTLYNLPIVFAVFWLTKALHEFGHGLTCKHYGGECHEIGFLFIVFAPFMFCNVTDSWTFKSKRHRFLVTAAGILTELFLAGIAAIAWYFTDPPSFTHQLAFNVIVACSISTILFNANPLMRFDGYYMMMDYLEVPNLRQRAMLFIRNLFVRYVLGGYPEEKQEEHRYRYMFPIYSIAAWFYRWFITISILTVVYRYLKKLRLEWLGQVLVIISLGTFILLPLFQFGKLITRRREALGVSSVRLLLLLAGIAMFAGAALFWPFSQHVTVNFILEPQQLSYIRTEAPGEIHWTSEEIREAAWINTAGEQLAHLDNPDLLLEERSLNAQIEQTQIRLGELVGRDLPEQVHSLREDLQALQEDLRQVTRLISELNVAAPFKGEVLTRQRDLHRLEGKFVSRGVPLLLLADTDELQAKVWVSEKDYTRIFHEPAQRGQAAELMLYAFPDRTFTGSISDVNLHNEDNMGEFGEKLALSNKVGGEVITEYDPVSEREKPVQTVYEVNLTLDEDKLPASARPYLSGRVRIDCGKFTLYSWTRDSLLRFISPEVRL